MHGSARKLGNSSNYFGLPSQRRCRSIVGMRIPVTCACIALLSHQTVSAKPLQPAGKWVVDFGDSRCVAQRIYGEPADPIYLLIKASAVGDGLQLSVAKKGPNGFGVQEKAKLTFGKGEPVELSQLRYGVEKKQVRTVNLTRDQVNLLGGASELKWFTANLDVSLPLGAMGNLVKIVHECRATLAEDWNGTAEKEALLKQGPTADRRVVNLFATRDYPSQAVMAEQSGTANVVALVDEKGKLADCMVVETSGVAVLDAQTCLVMMTRGKFSAAIGSDGKPAKSIFTQRIRWEMPGSR
jgi:TonB family protein